MLATASKILRAKNNAKARAKRVPELARPLSGRANHLTICWKDVRTLRYTVNYNLMQIVFFQKLLVAGNLIMQ